ncbi:MAG: cytochrome P450 [Chloroflexota bacterium]
MMTIPAGKTLPPGSFGFPYIGETIQFLRNPQYLAERHKEHGPIVRSHLFGRPTAMLRGEDANRFLLHTGMEHFSWGGGWPPTFRVLLGRSLFLMDGTEHARNRKLIAPAFHGQALAGYLLTMDEVMQKYLQRWLEMGEFAWFNEMKKLTFVVASKLLIGSDPGAQTEQLSQYFTDLTNGLFAVPLNWPMLPYGKAIRARDALLAFVEEQIRLRQAMDVDDLGERPDALTMLVHSRDEDGNQLELEELKAQAILLLFAGHETTTSMVTSACYYLAIHPEVLERARAEQTAFTDEQLQDMSTFRQMPYLDMFLKEVERISPPVTGGFRGVVKPFEFNGYYVPTGWQVQYNIAGTHIDEDNYPDVDRFDPERFADGKASPFSLVGFGGGARICVGKAFALLEMKLLLAHLLRGYSWTLVPDQDLSIVRIPTRRHKDNLLVRFKRL